MEATMTETKLEVDGLNVRFATRDGLVDAVRGVSFTLGREKLAIVGESGSGKSTVGRALLKLHPASARIDARAMRFGDTDLLKADEKAMRAIRGRRISMIMQDPKYSLNPVMRRSLARASQAARRAGEGARAGDAGVGAHPRPRARP
jgi:peptide/nickel transport system ATP-binding protein